MLSSTCGNGTVVRYVCDELDRVSEVWYTENGGSKTKAYTYEYDANGSPVGIMYRDSTMTADSYQYYLFVRNLQGDIVAIYSSTGTLLAHIHSHTEYQDEPVKQDWRTYTGFGKKVEYYFVERRLDGTVLVRYLPVDAADASSLIHWDGVLQ